MKKLLAFTLAAALTLALCVTGAGADPQDRMGKVLKDFSVKTISGETFTLSESLKTHDLVLINFWATWCGPCRMEFPCLETAWEKYKDRVDVVALSVEPNDSMEILTSFAADNGLHFQIGRDEDEMFLGMGGSLIPTTLVVNKDGRVVAVEIGSKTSEAEFTDMFDSLLGDA